MGAFAWTETRIVELKQRWSDDGMSASQVARSFGGGCTRNAVVSKVHRLIAAGRMEKRVDPDSERKAALRARAAREAREFRKAAEGRQDAASALRAAGAPEIARLEPEVIRTVPTVSMEDVSSTQCRWPIGDPLSKNFAFCGAQQKPGHPYCIGHCGIAYQPSHAQKAAQARALGKEPAPVQNQRQKLRAGQTSLWR